VQLSALLPPSTTPKVPAGQLEHRELPFSTLNVPGAHGSQEEDPELVKLPGGQGKQLSELPPPASKENFPAAQGVQEMRPNAGV
jgi:hypothetical protein